jgi:hypothetical protein
METNKKSPFFNNYKFNCINCDYFTDKKSSYDKHLLTSKHIKLTQVNTFSNKSCPKIIDVNKLFNCKLCDKEFTSRVGLWKHNKKCNGSHLNVTDDDNSDITNLTNLTTLICELVKSNTDIHKSVIELCKNGTNNNNNSGNTNIINSNNKTFNLQVFLNETCKDAMNISDFIESVQLQVSDLENVGKVGYIEGISNIIIKNLNALEVERRPVHCTDKKREVMYVKEDNVWEKEDEANKKLRKAIRKIAHKNICMFKAYREKYPDCEEYDSKKNSQYNTIIYESMGGKGDNDYEKDTKIIKKIAKVVGIEKS